ncbi:MAG: hypothetical protein IKU86_10595 [Thermoguttaceae bacterium]|nr:hypothetical protein [Thermoguttaceae bacterium]
MRLSSILDRILSRSTLGLSVGEAFESGRRLDASARKRLVAQDRMILIMPKRARFDKSD